MVTGLVGGMKTKVPPRGEICMCTSSFMSRQPQGKPGGQWALRGGTTKCRFPLVPTVEKDRHLATKSKMSR